MPWGPLPLKEMGQVWVKGSSSLPQAVLPALQDRWVDPLKAVLFAGSCGLECGVLGPIDMEWMG